MSWLSSIFRPFHTASQLKAMQRYATETEKYIKSLEQQVGTLREQVQTLDKANDRLDDAYTAACNERDTLTGQLANAQSEITALRLELAQANKDLDTLDEINRLVDKFTDEREKYKQRIRSLKNTLADTRAMMRNMLPTDTDSEVTSIAFNRNDHHHEGVEPISYRTTPRQEEDKTDESEWLMDLPD